MEKERAKNIESKSENGDTEVFMASFPNAPTR